MKNKSYKVVLVDDHEFILDGICRMLKLEESIEIVGVYTSSLDALVFMENTLEKIDILITDLSMPLMDGVALIKRLKQNNNYTKILALTMQEDTSYLKEIYNLNVEGYLLKSSTKEEFTKAIFSILDGKKFYASEMLKKIISEVKRENKDDVLLQQLTKREIEIIRLIVQEKTSNEIGTQLEISKQTVDSHRKNILQKLGVKSVVGLIKFALQHNISK